MSTDERPDRATFVAAAHRRGVLATAEYTIGLAWYIGVWFWLIALAVGGVIVYIQQRGGGDVDISAVGGPAGSARFFLFVMGIILPLTLVAVHVAAGGTRRAFAHGLWLGALAVGATFGLVAAAVAWLEWWLFARAGWTVEPEQDQLFDDGSQFGLVLLVQGVSCLVYFLAGISIALCYYRAGGVRGTALLPVSLVPVALVEVTLQSGYFGSGLARALGVPELSTWAAALGGLAAAALAAALVRVVSRDVALRPVEFARSVTA